MSNIDTKPLGEPGGVYALKEASLGAKVLERARERSSRYPQELFTELMRSLPATSIETFAWHVSKRGEFYINMVKRPEDDVIADWRDKYYGRGVMILNQDVSPDGSMSLAWEKLQKTEIGGKVVADPVEVCTKVIPVGGRGKETAWIHAVQVNEGLADSNYFSLDELTGLSIIDHHKIIIANVLNTLPIMMEENRYFVRDESGNLDNKNTRDISLLLWENRKIFPLSVTELK